MNKRKHRSLRYILLAVTVIGLTVLAAVPARAQLMAGETECTNSQLPYYDALIEPPADTYDVFVKMGKRGQTADVRLYAEASDMATCVAIGAGQANSETWQRLGEWQSPDSGSSRLQLASDIFASLPDANRPTVMLVPHVNPPCVPTNNCNTTVDGQPAYIEPTGTLLSEDTLHVTRVTNPAEDQLLRVDYYAGGQFLYSTPTLQPFDLRYVPGGDQTLSRVMQYKSKQQVILQEKVYISFASDFRNLLFRLFNSNKVLLQLVMVVLILLSIGMVALAIIHAVHRRRLWKQHHGLTKEMPVIMPGNISPEPSTAPGPHYIKPDSPWLQRTRQIAPIIGLVIVALFLVVMVDNYVVQIFRVDGQSMERTLQTDDKLLVSKLERTISSLNRQEYVPRRGEVVVFHKARSDQFLQLSEGEDEETYVVKRVIGLPGERVVVTNGVITVYNQDNPDGFKPDASGDWQETMVPGTEENLDIVLGAGEIFVIGDNRGGSLDSRTNGPIKLNEIVGRARARFLPFSGRRLL